MLKKKLKRDKGRICPYSYDSNCALHERPLNSILYSVQIESGHDGVVLDMSISRKFFIFWMDTDNQLHSLETVA